MRKQSNASLSPMGNDIAKCNLFFICASRLTHSQLAGALGANSNGTFSYR